MPTTATSSLSRTHSLCSQGVLVLGLPKLGAPEWETGTRLQSREGSLSPCTASCSPVKWGTSRVL